MYKISDSFHHVSRKYLWPKDHTIFVMYCLNKAISVCFKQGWGQFNSGIGIAGQFQFQFQFRNWNWNWNWWNWKWNWNWKPWNWNWNWNWKPELNFLQLLPQHLHVNQPFPNFSFNHVNRGGYDLSCDWLLMQQVCSWAIAPPVVWSQKTHGEGTLFPLSRQRPEGLKMVTINISLPPWETKLLSLLNKWMILGLGVKLSPDTSFSLILQIGILRSFVIIHWDKCHRTLLINLMISPHCFS